jgi:hypothetical protein
VTFSGDPGEWDDPYSNWGKFEIFGGVGFDGNLIIHGDNLHALKALLPLYAGTIDCVFIDPPYNTGQEGWSYNDNVNGPMIREWLAANPVGIEDGLRHDKWLAMMWPRLRLLPRHHHGGSTMRKCVDAGSPIYARREGRGVGLMMAEFHGLPVTYKAVGAAVCLAHPLRPLPGWSI